MTTCYRQLVLSDNHVIIFEISALLETSVNAAYNGLHFLTLMALYTLCNMWQTQRPWISTDLIGNAIQIVNKTQ